MQEHIAKDVSELVGHTPILEFGHLSKSWGCQARILGKMECMNPCGSVKDRIAVTMIDEAEKAGKITPGKTVLVEPTSGNTGIAMAFIAAARGYKCIITMPETMSMERRLVVRAFGTTVYLSPGHLGMRGAVRLAAEIVSKNPDAYMLQQFTNKSNPLAHELYTGPEIWNDTAGKVDVFVCGVGTGGTLQGCAVYLKSQNPKIKIVAVEPTESAILSGGTPGPHKIQGIGAGFVPEVLDREIIDEVFAVSSETAIEMARRVSREEGALVGISSGAAVYAALEIGKREELKGKNIVAIIPSFGERYISTALFEDLRNECNAMKPEIMSSASKGSE